MDIEFKGYAISDGRVVVSNCILQGEKAGANRVYLKNPDQPGYWVEVNAETVNQTKYEDNDRVDQK